MVRSFVIHLPDGVGNQLCNQELLRNNLILVLNSVGQ
jgi:hypothetical protein